MTSASTALLPPAQRPATQDLAGLRKSQFAATFLVAAQKTSEFNPRSVAPAIRKAAATLPRPTLMSASDNAGRHGRPFARTLKR